MRPLTQHLSVITGNNLLALDHETSHAKLIAWSLGHKVNVNPKGTHLASNSGLLPAETVLEAKAVPVKLKHMAAVSQSIQECTREALITEELSPALELEVGGDDQAAPEVAVGADLEEESRPVWGEGDEAHFVRDEEVQLLQLR